MEFEDPEDLHGIEWDFLMHDRDGRIAVLTTAGAGPVPPAVNSKRVMVECAIGAVIELPIRGESIDQRPPYLRGLNHFYWFEFSRRGLYAYDWNLAGNGPYEGISAPSSPLRIAQLEPAIAAAAALCRTPISFSGATRLPAVG